MKRKLGGGNCNEEKSLNHNAFETFRKYIHDIRNMKELNEEMINNIYHMTNEEKLEIILTFNDVVQGLKGLIDD